MEKNKPRISFVIPTYNAERYLERCLASITSQDYPRSAYEVLVVDGGSSDRTIEIARKYGVKILPNPKRDAETGKAIGIRAAQGYFIALVDADNELVGKNWLREMIKPLLKETDIFGVESPWLIRKEDGILNKYITCLGIGDPLAHSLGICTKESFRGENYIVYETSSPKHFLPILETNRFWSLGVNGFIWRKSVIESVGFGEKFEEANFVSLLVSRGITRFATLTTEGVGIYHHHIISFSDFVRKRLKIGNKFLARKYEKRETWVDRIGPIRFITGVLYCSSFIGPLAEGLLNFARTREVAWLLHPFMCLLTVALYAFVFFSNSLGRLRSALRNPSP